MATDKSDSKLGFPGGIAATSGNLLVRKIAESAVMPLDRAWCLLKLEFCVLNPFCTGLMNGRQNFASEQVESVANYACLH